MPCVFRAESGRFLLVKFVHIHSHALPVMSCIPSTDCSLALLIDYPPVCSAILLRGNQIRNLSSSDWNATNMPEPLNIGPRVVVNGYVLQHPALRSELLPILFFQALTCGSRQRCCRFTLMACVHTEPYVCTVADIKFRCVFKFLIQNPLR